MTKLQPKHILILSSSFGQGHMATARALMSAAQAHPDFNLTVDIIDFSDEISHIFSESSKRIYELNSKHMPLVHKMIYTSTDVNHAPIRIANLLTYPTRKAHLKKLLVASNPDLVISNYPIWQRLSLQVLKASLPDVEFATLITDSITVHSSWVKPDSDFYIVANEPTASSLQKLGVDSRKIHAIGYPVHEAFSEPAHRSRICQELDLPPENKIILFSASALRSSYVRNVCRRIHSLGTGYSLIVVAGRDQDLHDAIASDQELWSHPATRLLGWRTDMPELIKASDIVITKAGGSTVMECVAARKPMIINKIIPGQEEGNAEFVERFNLGLVASKPVEIASACQIILSRIDDYEDRLAQHARPHAARDILSYVATRLESHDKS